MKNRSSIQRISYRRQPGKIIRPLILLLTLLAFMLIGIVIWTFFAADQVMRQEPVPLQTISSNVMPAFSVVSFASLDGQTQLHGWYIRTRAQPVSTIIMVHEQGKNRLQFGLDTPLLYRHLTDLGFNLLSFDLRNTGQSGGELSGFGYAEWADVVAAIRHVQQHAPTSHVLLYGFGTGVSASLLAWDNLPAPGSERDTLPREIRDLAFDQSYVIGLLLDAPGTSPDNTIQALYRERNCLERTILARSVPYAVRMSSSAGRKVNHSVVLGSCHIPVYLVHYKEDTLIGEASATVVTERQRLHPDLTMVTLFDEPGHADGFLTDQQAYLSGLDRFLNRYFLQTAP